MQQWHKEPKPKTAATEQEGIQQDTQEDPRTGFREANSRDVQWVPEGEKLYLMALFKHILISVNSFIGVLNSI
jgi:hypothetical protein